MAGRTRRGSVKSTTRKKYGSGKSKVYPVFDARSARAALKLRGRSKKMSKSAVVNKVSRWANAHHNAAIKAAVKRARKADAK